MNPAAIAAAARGDFANCIVASTPGGIERQEAAGQAALVSSPMLPKEVRGATHEQLTALGINFGAEVDELFVQCELPAGWTKRGTEQSMYSDLLDSHGRKRAGIFYKAAFYDRRAYMRMNRRFDLNPYREGSQEGYMRCVVVDTASDVVVFDAGEWKYGDCDHGTSLETAARDWLDKQHSQWRNPLACW